jgi:chromosome segregation ATPase
MDHNMHDLKAWEHKYKDLHHDHERCHEKLEHERHATNDFKSKMMSWESKYEQLHMNGNHDRERVHDLEREIEELKE